MEILAKVDESDIGAIHEGQPVRFTVQPYPSESFEGTVRQVRLQSTTQENVVNYTVVISVANKSGKLLPGMTATVSFITGSAENVLMVPNGALRFRPTNAMLAASGVDTTQAQAGMTRESRTRPAGATASARPARAAGATASANASARPAGASGVATSRLWYLDEQQVLRGIPVEAGLTDGQKTAVSGPGLKVGMQVIVGVSSGTATTPTTNGSSPFQSTQPQRGPGGPPPGM